MIDKFKAFNQFTNLLALAVLLVAVGLFVCKEREGGLLLLGGGLTMLKTGAEHAQPGDGAK